MLGLDRLVGPRATPRARSVVMERRRGRVNVRYTAGAPADYIFTADIYAFAARRHPDRHLGWWRFELPPDRREAALVMEFDPIRADSVALSVNGATIPATDKWHNPEYAFDPLGDLQLVMRNRDGGIRRIEPVAVAPDPPS